MIIGVWFRLFVCINGNFYFVLTGQIIAAISQAFIQNPVAKMATTWFGDKEVTLPVDQTKIINLERFSNSFWKYGNASRQLD